MRKNKLLIVIILCLMLFTPFNSFNENSDNLINNIEENDLDVKSAFAGNVNLNTVRFEHVKGTINLKVSCTFNLIDIEDAYDGDFAKLFVLYDAYTYLDVYNPETGSLIAAHSISFNQFSYHQIQDGSYGQVLEGYSQYYLTNYGSTDLNIFNPNGNDDIFVTYKELHYSSVYETTDSDYGVFNIYWNFHPIISLDSEYYNYGNTRFEIYDKITANWIEFDSNDLILSHPEYKIRVYDSETNNLIFEDIEYQYFKYYREIEINSLKVQNNANEVINCSILENGHYKGAYSFDLEEVNTQPEDFNDVSAVGSLSYISNSIDEHDKVLTLDDRVVGNVYTTLPISEMGSGSFDLWIRTTDSTKRTNFFLSDGDSTSNSLYVMIDVNLFYYRTSSGYTVITSAESDIWYNINIDFRCSGGIPYADLDEGTWKITINDVSYGSYIFRGNPIGMDYLSFQTDSTDLDYLSYFDGIDFSNSEGYYEGRNLEVNTSQDLWSWVANPNWESGYYGWNEDLDDWNDYSGIGCNVLIDEEVGGHKNVIELDDQNATTFCSTRYSITQLSGSVEYWIRITDISKNARMYIWDGGNTKSIYLAMHNTGYLQYYDGVWHQLMAIVSNIWYHIKIDFDITDFDIYIDGVSKGTSLSFNGIPTEFDAIVFDSYSSNTGYQIYVDGIGSSWDGSLPFSYSNTLENTTASILPMEIYSTLINPYSNVLTNYTQTNHFINITDIYGNILEYQILTNLENEIVYTPPNVKNCLITLSDQFFNYLDYKNYYLKVNDNLLYEQYFYREIGDSVNISIYDRFEQYLTSTIHIIDRDDNFINMNLTLYSFKILNQLHESSILNITNQISVDIVFSENIAVDELISLKFKEANYSLYYIDDSQIEHTLNFTLSESRLIILNTTNHEVYFSYFDISGLGLDSDTARLYINNERREIGKNWIKGDTCQLKVLDYFNTTIYFSSISLAGLIEFNIYIPVYTMLINNNYSESMEISIQRKNIDIEFKQILNAQGGFSIRLLADIEYIVKIYYTNGTLAETKIILLDENFKNLSFGFYESDFDTELLKSELNDWILIVVILGSFLGVSIGIIIYLRNSVKKKEPVRSKHNKTRLGLYD